MSSDEPRDPFNDEAQDKPTIRDKTNDAPRLPPPMAVQKPAPNLSPMGTMGIRAGLPSQHPSFAETRVGMSVAEPDRSEPWRITDGKLISMPGYSFMAKLTETPDRKGLNGGTIEQLVVAKDGRQVALYEREWKQEPSTPEHREAVHRIRNGLDDSQERSFKGIETNPDKSKGWER